jgi:hypothetical protein
MSKGTVQGKIRGHRKEEGIKRRKMVERSLEKRMALGRRRGKQ